MMDNNERLHVKAMRDRLKKILPELGFKRPLSRLSAVLLPQPEGPSRNGIRDRSEEHNV